MLLRLLGSDYADATTQLGTMSSEDIRAYLRSKSAEEILRAQYYCGWVHSFRDGHVLPTTDWIGAIPEGDYPRIPIMIGTNEYEFKSMMPIYGPSVKTWFNVPSTSYNWLDLYRVLKGELSLSDVLATETDLGLYETIGEVRSLKWRATYCEDVVRAFKEKAPFHRVYVYRFKWDGGGDPDLEDFRFVIGAAHFTEIPFFFGSDDDAFGFSFTDANKPGRKSLQRAMMGYLSNFVWYGNPNIGPHTLWLLRNTKGLYWPSWMTCEGCPKFITFDADLNHIIIRLGNDETTPGEVAEAIADAREEYPDYLGLMDVLEVK